MGENSKIEQIKKMYPEGTKIKLNYMKDNYNPVPSGTQGIVDHVDDAGQIHVKWENGSSLALIYDEDDFEKIKVNTVEKPFERLIKYIDTFNGSTAKESTIAELKREIEVKWFTTLNQTLKEKMKKAMNNLSTGLEMLLKYMICQMMNL